MIISAQGSGNGESSLNIGLSQFRAPESKAYDVMEGPTSEKDVYPGSSTSAIMSAVYDYMPLPTSPAQSASSFSAQMRHSLSPLKLPVSTASATIYNIDDQTPADAEEGQPHRQPSPTDAEEGQSHRPSSPGSKGNT